jgi:hypothetical protein
MDREVQKWSHKRGEGTGRQSTSITYADMERVYGMIMQNTVETLEKLNFEVFEHPLYSLDLTPSDSPPLDHLKKPLEAVGLPRTSS